MTSLKTIREKNRKEFDDRFTYLGYFGEKRFAHIMVSDYKKSDPIIHAEDNEIVQLKKFLSSSEDAIIEAVREWVEQEYDYVQRQLLRETDENIIEYITGKRNMCVDLLEFLKDK